VPRTAKSQISFADWELLQQGIELEPVLQSISDFLDDHEEMIEAVRRDLQRGLKKPATGRNGLTPSQVLRSFVLKSVKSWDYRELRERIADGYTLRGSRNSIASRCPNTMRLTAPTQRWALNERLSLKGSSAVRSADSSVSQGSAQV
jgi:hypothetical protein